MADLSPLSGPPRRTPFLVLDIESKDGESQKAGFTRPFMVGVSASPDAYHPFFDADDSPYSGDVRYHMSGGCVDRAMRWILRPRHAGKNIYAHNAGRFDYLFLLPWLMGEGEKHGFKFSVVPVSSSIQVLDVWKHDKAFRWRFLDSYKLIPTSLDKAAKAFGLEGKLSHDLDMREDDPRWIQYNRVDCEQLYNVLLRFHHYIENVLCGEVGVTAPSTSMRLFRRRFLKKPLRRNEETHEFVRTGYFGGRVEVFWSEGRELAYYDINSSYPNAMLSDMPGGVATLWEGPPPERFQKTRLGFVEADVWVPPMHVPPLPIRGKKEYGVPEKLIFPTGNVTGVWEWDELQLALELGCEIHRWGRSAWYDRVPLFKDYVAELYHYRDRSRPDYDDGLAQVVKIMMNSLYGKFGMRTLRQKYYRWDDPDIPETAVPVQPDPDCPIWVAEEETDAPYIIPQISARVTALARIALYRHMQRVWSAGGRVYYCDTDSIVCDDVPIETSTELGGLKDEYPEHSGQLHGRFLGPKLYILEAPGFVSVKAKGLGRSRDLASVERYAAGETLYEERLEKVGTLARALFSRGPQLRKVPRTHKPQDAKRKFVGDTATRPYHVKMW